MFFASSNKLDIGEIVVATIGFIVSLNGCECVIRVK